MTLFLLIGTRIGLVIGSRRARRERRALQRSLNERELALLDLRPDKQRVETRRGQASRRAVKRLESTFSLAQTLRARTPGSGGAGPALEARLRATGIHHKSGTAREPARHEADALDRELALRAAGQQLIDKPNRTRALSRDRSPV